LDDCRDENLVAACRSGDKSAYAILVRRHYKHVFLVCLGVLGTTHDAEDIAQDAMLRGFTEIRKLRDGSQFGRWITKTAKNLCINFVQRKKRAGKIIGETANRQNARTTEIADLQRAIASLSPQIRLPLVMYYFNGESVKNVAEKLSLSGSAVYARLQTAIKQLHKLLDEQGEKK
jgi:RNA polymerase sigma-70 factor (ECF subfamily)